MTGREWKPGEVAMLTVPDLRCDGRAELSPLHVGIRDNVGGWVSGTAFGRRLSERDVRDARPLVVIDPEDREQAERLHARVAGCVSFESLQAALREFADPKPPKPEEPTGDGAVVEDAAGRRWTRIAREGYVAEGAPRENLSPPWRRRGMTGRWWDNIDVVRVLSPGYDAEATS